MASEFIQIVLGIIQGLAEFLPISSSAHLIIFSQIMMGGPISLALNVGFHAGTLLAVIIYFYKDFMKIMDSTFKDIVRREKSFESRVLLPALIIGTIPAAVVGLTLSDAIEKTFHNELLGSVFPLVVVGWLMVWVDKKGGSQSHAKTFDQLSILDGLKIGLAQVVAMIPGVSRSGITITMARFLNFDRVAAARFSFLLGTPAILGATILKSSEIINALGELEFQLGVISSFVSGILTIHYFLKLLKKVGFLWFAIYRTALAVFILFYVNLL